jgi:hypothetical protein
VPEIAGSIPDPAGWTLEALSERDEHGDYAALQDLLRRCVEGAYALSDDLGARYFTHSDARQSVGA